MRKSLAILLAITLVFSMFGSLAFAAEAELTAQQKYDALADKGIFAGMADGSAGLDQAMTRAQFARVAALIKGLDGIGAPDTKVVTVKPFSDVELGLWYTEEVAAAKEDGIFVGNADGTFNPNGDITIQELAVVVVTLLGLEVVADATVVGAAPWSAGYIKAIMNAGIAFPTNYTEAAVRSDLASLAYTADMVINPPAVVDVAIESASAVGVKTVEVKFNQAVDTDVAVVKVMKGAAIYSSAVAWNDAKDTATVTTVIELPAADYSAVVTGLGDALTAEFTVAAEAAASVAVTSTTIDDATAAAQVAFVVANQYGEDMEVLASATIVSAYNVTQGAAVTITSPAQFAINTLATPTDFVAGDVVRVTVTYKGLTTQANVSVVDPSSSAAIELGGIVLATDDTKLNAADGTVKLAYTLLNQYGNATDLSAAVAAALPATLNGVQFITSDAAVISEIAVVDDADGNGEIELTVAGAGTAVITAVVISSGSVSTATIVVAEDPAVKTVTFSSPTALVAAGETTVLTIVVTDQFGTVITNDDAAAQAIVFANGSLDTAGVFTTGALTAGDFTVNAGTGSDADAYGTVTFTVEAAAVAQEVKSASFTKIFELGATHAVVAGDLTVIDQYGRAFEGAITVASDAAAVTVAGTTLTAAVVGTANLTVTVGTVSLAVPVSVIASADVKSYTMNAIGTVHNGGAAYNVAVTLSGVDANGKAVNLASDVPQTITTSNAAIANVSGTSVVGVAAGTATISAWKGGVVVASGTVTVTDVAPVATTVEWVATPAALDTENVKTLGLVIVKDQYGVDITTDTTLFFAGGTLVGTNGLVTGAGIVTEDITVITSNGLSATATVSLN